MIGTKYGKWLVVAPDPQKKWYYICQCDCGNQKSVYKSNLTLGHSTSCGCRMNRQGMKSITPGDHGMSNTRTWRSWQRMKSRCYKPTDMYYHNYGGKGIKVCDRWRDSFDAFLADMGERPEGRTLDRIDGDLDYTPQNCRWATPKEQALNKKNTIKIEYQGVTYTLPGLCRHLNLHENRFRKHYRAGIYSLHYCITVSRLS